MSSRFCDLATYALLLATAVVALALPERLGVEASIGAPATGEPIQMELVLLIDTSGSVDNTEYMMQRQGYAEAFRNPAFTGLVKNHGGLAVLYVEWDDATNQTIRIPWTRLDTRAECLAYAVEIDALVRMTSGNTAMAPAIEFATNEIRTNSYAALRRIIDVSGDGYCKNWKYHEGIVGGGSSSSDNGGSTDWGTPWNDVMAAAAADVDQINGIYIGTNSTVVDFYTNVLPQGRSAFAMHVNDFSDFPATILQKLMREVGSTPRIYD